MHEFSLALEVVSLAGRELARQEARSIMEIIIEVGDLSGVEADAFESALGLLTRDSVLENAGIRIRRTQGTGKCIGCNLEFVMHNRMDACPQCNCFPSEITGGKEFRVVSMKVV